MIGKKTFALSLARDLLGNLENNPNFILIEPRSIDDIRNLKKLFHLKSYGGGQRLVVLDNAHFLTTEAANAFLKILEEPPVDSIIILVSAMPLILPQTIVSRCEEVKFTEASSEESIIFLHDLVKNSKQKLAKEDQDFLVKLAQGRIGLIVNLLEANNLTEAQSSVDDLRKLLNKGVFERMEYAKKSYEGEKYMKTVNYWLYWVSAHLAISPKNKKIVENLLALNELISQPQYNHRLALENFLLNL